MRILISGATGFVGRALCRHLSATGDEAWAFSRRPAQAKASLDGVGRVFAWDAATVEPPAEAFEDVDAVIHLAGESVVGRWTKAKREAIRASRVDSTQLLVAAMAKLESPPKTLISASAIGYYGEKGEAEVTEESPPDNDFLGQVAVAWEAAALRAELSGVRVVCLRTGIILGQGGGALEAMLLPFKLGVGGPLGSGNQWWSWVAFDDVIGMIDFALRTPEVEGPLNVTAPEPVRQKDFANALGKVLHRPAFLPAPAFALKLVLGGFSAELLSSKKVLPKKAERLGYRFRFSDLGVCLERVIGS
jgi:uncharacterized protein (TIGR01777 family)